MPTATAVFEITGWTPSAIDAPAPAGGPALQRASVARTFKGDLEGESSAELLFCKVTSNEAGYVAMDRFVGTLAGRQGSFVMLHGAPVEGGVAQLFGHIVPGSGTGGLQGLRGQVRFGEGGNGSHKITLDYELA